MHLLPGKKGQARVWNKGVDEKVTSWQWAKLPDSITWDAGAGTMCDFDLERDLGVRPLEKTGGYEVMGVTEAASCYNHRRRRCHRRPPRRRRRGRRYVAQMHRQTVHLVLSSGCLPYTQG